MNKHTWGAGLQKQQSIMRRQSNRSIDPVTGIPKETDEGNLEFFYEEPLDKEEYDYELIKDLFFRRRVKFTNETRMRRFFGRGETRQTTTMQDASEIDYTKSEGTSSDIMYGDISNTDNSNDQSGDWDNTISPIKGRQRRAGMLKEENEKFTLNQVSAVMATQQKRSKDDN